MANTDVTLEPNEGTFVPSLPTIAVAAGDTITLHNNGGGPAFLFFSPDALTLLSLKPGDVPSIPGTGKEVFTFSSSAPGAYSVYFAASSEMAPQGFPNTAGASLWLLAESGLFPVLQVNPMSSGH